LKERLSMRLSIATLSDRCLGLMRSCQLLTYYFVL
jgi:hypothetical protein